MPSLEAVDELISILESKDEKKNNSSHKKLNRINLDDQAYGAPGANLEKAAAIIQNIIKRAENQQSFSNNNVSSNSNVAGTNQNDNELQSGRSGQDVAITVGPIPNQDNRSAYENQEFKEEAKQHGNDSKVEENDSKESKYETNDRSDSFNIKDYVIERPLTTDGINSVYSWRRINDQNDRLVSKNLKSEDNLVPDAERDYAKCQKRFKKEIQLLMGAKHRNIVAFKGLVEEPNIGFILFMERGLCDFVQWIEQICTDDNLSDDSRTEELALRLIKPILEVTLAIGYLHDNGFAHCDLKPQNIVMFPNSVPKLIDILGDAELADFDMGTTGYYPPGNSELSRQAHLISKHGFGAGLTDEQIAKLIKLTVMQERDIWAIGKCIIGILKVTGYFSGVEESETNYKNVVLDNDSLDYIKNIALKLSSKNPKEWIEHDFSIKLLLCLLRLYTGSYNEFPISWMPGISHYTDYSYRPTQGAPVSLFR